MQRLALISVSDKSGVLPFAKTLVDELGFRILSTGGTARLLRENGVDAVEVSDHTGFPEMMDGRVKTLHPKIHGGLLCLRNNEEHCQAAEANDIEMIELVVVNLYPFEETVAKPGVTLAEAIEQIDIGGPSMLRSAAKNNRDVTVVCDPGDYDRVLDSLKANDEAALLALRSELALKVYRRTSEYDGAISEYLSEQALKDADEPDLDSISGFPKVLAVDSEKAMALRYGENPHQQAALYGSFMEHFDQLQGKELSYNNILDISAAAYLIGEFERPTVAILKHTNPCGVACADHLTDAWDLAYETDRQAPFGGIIVVNNTMDEHLASKIADIFCEVIIAPGFTPGAQEIFGKKKNLRLLISRSGFGPETLQEIRTVPGGFLAQDRDQKRINPKSYTVPTKREPTEEEWRALLFGWRVVRHVKSNAIVYAGLERTLGIGAGQMSRVDSSRIAVWKAGEAGLSLDGSIVASDAFFPFADGLIAAADSGACAAIQPGGSVRDAEVIAAADERDMAMVFTGSRHFRH
ncbi:MAG: bifunctional phosphoribosylaminoimidazolecarboxamide formyltransferase/IMP cyclohydrolase [Opitutales bacterium]|nr:bifunctional phosphoribosylaminoimidazolecarboxamide formyltransferase/IMP cyclohydrolase [Opitutales bacterium]